MASEIQVRLSLQVNKDFTSFRSNPTAFLADMDGSVGPTPGSILVSTSGTNVDLSQLKAKGGMCWVQNLDAENYVEFGPYDPLAMIFYPVGEILPGECYLIRLSRFIGGELGAGSGTGTGTTGSGVGFRFRAVGAACDVVVFAFDK